MTSSSSPSFNNDDTRLRAISSDDANTTQQDTKDDAMEGGMSDMERYLFDLNGFLVVRGVGRRLG